VEGYLMSEPPIATNTELQRISSALSAVLERRTAGARGSIDLLQVGYPIDNCVLWMYDCYDLRKARL